MKCRSLIVFIVAGLALLTACKIVWNGFHDSEDDPSDVFSHSLSEARDSSVLISSLLPLPSSQPDHSNEIQISEAWVERCAVHRYSTVWFHRRVPASGFIVVIKLKQPTDPRFVLWPPERGASFTWAGGRFYIRHFDRMPAFPIILSGGTSNDRAPVVTLQMSNPPLAPTRPPANNSP